MVLPAIFSRRRLLIALIVVAVLLGTSLYGCYDNPSTPATETVQQDDVSYATGTPVEGQYIVVYKKETAVLGKTSAVEAITQSITEQYNIDQDAVQFIYADALAGAAIRMKKDVADAVQHDSRVAYVEQDRWLTLDEKISPAMQKTAAQSVPWGITRVGGSADGTGKVAWIIDTGIDFTHPDLNVDVARSRNFVNTRKNANDDNGHGSHVSGTIAAKNNTSGVIGVAPNASVVAVKVLNSRGSGTYSEIIAGVNYVASAGKAGDAANMSLGGGASATLDNAVSAAASKGIKFALAAGNESQNANNVSPARVNGANIYTVSAIDNADVFASFSNFANPPVDFAAPGVSVLSTYKNGGYATGSGTSMAAPHVCGILLLGNVSASGNAINDPDGNADPIAHR